MTGSRRLPDRGPPLGAGGGPHQLRGDVTDEGLAPVPVCGGDGVTRSPSRVTQGARGALSHPPGRVPAGAHRSAMGRARRPPGSLLLIGVVPAAARVRRVTDEGCESFPELRDPWGAVARILRGSFPRDRGEPAAPLLPLGVLVSAGSYPPVMG